MPKLLIQFYKPKEELAKDEEWQDNIARTFNKTMYEMKIKKDSDRLEIVNEVNKLSTSKFELVFQIENYPYLQDWLTEKYHERHSEYMPIEQYDNDSLDDIDKRNVNIFDFKDFILELDKEDIEKLVKLHNNPEAIKNTEPIMLPKDYGKVEDIWGVSTNLNISATKTYLEELLESWFNGMDYVYVISKW